MRNILKRPILSEKSASFEQKGKYVFEVMPSANKIEIRRAVEEQYNVKVMNVHTMNLKPKHRERWTGRRYVTGKTIGRKKAIITLADGQTIDLLGELEDTSQES